MLLFLIPTRIQTRRLQGWISQSYVIFGHHHTPRLVRLFNILTDNVILCSNSCKYMSQKYFYHCCKVACKMRLGNNIIEQKKQVILKVGQRWRSDNFFKKEKPCHSWQKGAAMFCCCNNIWRRRRAIRCIWLIAVCINPPHPTPPAYIDTRNKMNRELRQHYLLGALLAKSH